MTRPTFVNNDDLNRWDAIIDNDETIPKEITQSPIIREVCYAGIWLAEQLTALKCPDDIIVKIQWHAGKLSFGRDTWTVHQQILSDYLDNKLIFEDNSDIQTKSTFS